MALPLIAPAAVAARFATAGLLEALLPYVPRAVTQRILPTTLTKTPKQARELLLKTDYATNADNLILLENNTTQSNNSDESLLTLLQERVNNNLYLGGR